MRAVLLSVSLRSRSSRPVGDKMGDKMISGRAAAFAVAVSFAVGIVGSLAIRPPPEVVTSSAGSTQAASEVRIRWHLPVAFGTNRPALGDNILYVTKAIARTSGGAIQLMPSEPGKMVPPFSITDAVREGKVSAGYTWIGYDQGKIPASPLIAAVPFGMEPWEFMAWWYEADGRELAVELSHRYNTHPAPPEIDVVTIYRGVVPFILLQLLGLAIIFNWKNLVTWLPAQAYG